MLTTLGRTEDLITVRVGPRVARRTEKRGVDRPPSTFGYTRSGRGARTTLEVASGSRVGTLPAVSVSST